LDEFMRWADDGIFLSGRPHGETSVIANIFTRANGRTHGLVKGGRSRRIRPILQTGNGLKVEWRARLDSQLGVYTVELTEPTAARILDDKIALAGVNAIVALLLVLPERDPHPRLFSALSGCLAQAGSAAFPASIARFELTLLDELGFGLDLSKCAATGSTEALIYVSPRSGQAVSHDAGEPYRDKLLPLPAFLLDAAMPGLPDGRDIVRGFAMTGYFLNTHVFAENGKAMPKAREEFVRLIERSAAGAAQAAGGISVTGG
jgi:DNA repair protein RecO (recombination protein O)